MISTHSTQLLRSACRTFRVCDVVGVNNRYAVLAKFTDRGPHVVATGLTSAGFAGSISSEVEAVVAEARVATAALEKEGRS